MRSLLKAGSHILIEIAKELKSRFVPDTRATTTKELFRQFGEANSFAKCRIKKELHAVAPHIGWSDAEFDIEKQKQHGFENAYWVCDAIDGALHFLQGLTPWCITLTLMQQDEPLLALIYDAEREELFTAIKGEGAFLNGKQIQVHKKQHLSDAIVCTVHPNLVAKETMFTEQTLRSINILLPQVFATRLSGPASLQLAYVASGRTDAYWEYGNDVHDWLAGALLVAEAGGKVCTTDGTPFSLATTSGIVASNASLLPEFLRLTAFQTVDAL